jgi:hypothetical protein
LCAWEPTPAVREYSGRCFSGLRQESKAGLEDLIVVKGWMVVKEVSILVELGLHLHIIASFHNISPISDIPALSQLGGSYDMPKRLWEGIHAFLACLNHHLPIPRDDKLLEGKQIEFVADLPRFGTTYKHLNIWRPTPLRPALSKLQKHKEYESIDYIGVLLKQQSDNLCCQSIVYLFEQQLDESTCPVAKV